MQAPEQIETMRLALRRPRAGDADAVFERYASDPDVTRYLGWPRHRTPADTDAFLALSDAEWARWPAGPYLVFSRADGTLLGGSGLAFETSQRVGTGYVLARDAWGRGYATEALATMVALARDLGASRVHALVHVEHHASQRVLEKGGLTREGTLRRYLEFPNLDEGGAADVFMYARIF